MNLGATIKMIRKQQRHTQVKFASQCGITQTYLSLIEGNFKEPSLSVLKTISKKLNIPLPILFFLSMTIDDVEYDKRKAFEIIQSSLLALVNEFFIGFDLKK